MKSQRRMFGAEIRSNMEGAFVAVAKGTEEVGVAGLEVAGIVGISLGIAEAVGGRVAVADGVRR